MVTSAWSMALEIPAVRSNQTQPAAPAPPMAAAATLPSPAALAPGDDAKSSAYAAGTMGTTMGTTTGTTMVPMETVKKTCENHRGSQSNWKYRGFDLTRYWVPIHLGAMGTLGTARGAAMGT